MNTQIYFPSPFKRCKCPKAKYCRFPCHTNGVAAYREDDTKDDEDNQTFTYLYCFQQHPTETWQIPIDELEPHIENTPQPATVNANIISIAPEARAQIASAVNGPATPTTYDEIIPVVRQVYTDKRLATLRKKLKLKKLSLRGAALYVYNEPQPMEHLYRPVIDARMKLKQIIDEKLKSDPNAVTKSIASLTQLSKQSHNKKPKRKKRSSAPGPVPILYGYSGNQ